MRCNIGLTALLTVLFIYTAQASAETIKCIDTNNKPHTVKFLKNEIDVTYVDGVEYQYSLADKDTSTVVYSNEKSEVIFYVDVKNRDWFHLLQATVVKKDEKSVDFFYAKCDNVNVLK